MLWIFVRKIYLFIFSRFFVYKVIKKNDWCDIKSEKKRDYFKVYFCFLKKSGGGESGYQT
jgi:hypothetical protein